MKRAQWALAGLVGGLALIVGVTADAQVVTNPPPTTLKADVVKASRLKADVVDKVFTALGPAIRAQLKAGRAVEVPGLGVFRAVRVTEFKDLAPGGRPVTVPPRSYVEFTPTGDVSAAINAPGATANKEVQGYDFKVNPNAASGLKTDYIRTPGTRTR
jgi:nucleoid DNA-binding protein